MNYRRLAVFGSLLGITALVLNFLPSFAWRIIFAGLCGGFPPPIPGVIEETFLGNILGIARAVPTDATIWQWALGWVLTVILLFFSVVGTLAVTDQAPRRKHDGTSGTGVLYALVVLGAFLGHGGVVFDEFILGSGWAFFLSYVLYTLAIVGSGFAICVLMNRLAAPGARTS